ncbi:uncharacterized protein LY89DRAFT_723263 [Mollisia scopiformis]|uniref:Oxidoreductase-like protein n=1 Tax=Mollisia scopiformis TaxID=149040 RepID=A0A194WRN6_MOLSC|nr:uncharacterized protein LY89DRAFT_723263 [Mollisia scopiformis]KUJ10660.1 hypothetical protein LY89DRAFT_723263 [Mollisia scopiformis]
MAPYVEASSLSEITQLAGNPPKYPRNPMETKRQPLTLYIARVPGSRDIILTTLKPQLKNVTAEDVSASLYYLHLNTEDDIRFLQDDEGAGIITEEPEPVLEKPLPRKPLPETARSSLELNRSANTGAAPSPSASMPRRKPVTSIASFTEGRQQSSNSDVTIPRRPLGPRPFGTEVPVAKSVLPGVENVRPDSRSRRQDASLEETTGRVGNQSFSSVDHMVDEMNPNAFSITVIRRDPSSGAQWNVGTIYGQPVPGEAQHRRSKGSKKPYFDMSIQLTTPGYSQFRNVSATGNSADGMTEVSSPVGVSPRADISPVQPRSGSGFNRHLRMEGSSFWERSSMHKRAQSDFSGERAVPRGKDMSLDATTFGALNVSSNDSMSTGAVDSRSKGYIFESPWGGCCKFSTGSGGRTLKCKHSLPAPISAKTAGDFTSAPQPPSIVSELRFNLPSSGIFTPSTASDTTTKRSSIDSGRFNISKLGHMRNKLSPDKIRPPAPPPRPTLPPRPHPTSYAAMYPSDDEDRPPLPPRTLATSHLRPGYQQANSFLSTDTTQFEPDLSYSDEADDGDRLDLSIGREKAGGGNRGKRAKLGKLIVHDEGFKMLDLAVAANMGIWWSVWESENQ